MLNMGRLSEGVRRIGLMRGTFDPIHIAHLIVAEEVYTALGLTEMVFIPAGHPPHKLARASTEVRHRLAMVELGIASNPAAGIFVQLTHFVAVRRPGYVEDVSYNQQLETRLPGITERLQVVSVPQLDISSTDLRRRRAEHRSIKYQTPEVVERYIIEHDLYQNIH